MGLGIFNNTGLGVSEFPCPSTAPGGVACNVPTSYDKAQGQMDFIKRTTGDTVYIGLCGKKSTTKNYDIILTDAVPFYNVDGLALGDISVLGTGLAPTPSLVTITILACTA
jgi:hypothetical protein